MELNVIARVKRSKLTLVPVSVKLHESVPEKVVLTPVILRQEYVSGQFVLSLVVNTFSTELSNEYGVPSKNQGTMVYVGAIDVTVRPPSAEHLSFIITV